MANITTLVVMCFYGWDTLDWFNYENIGYRTGFMTVCQLPLIFLLAGKNNIIGFLTGHSYEKLNWLHRWTARCMWLTSTIHFAYWLADWWPYDDFVSTKIRTDPIAWKGLVAWCILGWINLSSSMPVRGWGYEFFVVQHVVSFSLMVGFIRWHVPSENWVWIWIVAALFWFDRLVRGLNVLYHNLSVFHPTQRREGNMGLWACKAEFTPLPHNTTRITIRNPPTSWKPGQHMFLSCHSVVPLQSHPFTAASIESDGKLEFLIGSQRGGTRRFFRHAEKLADLPKTDDDRRLRTTKTVALEGPYGNMRPLRQFDSVILFGGSTGAAFVVPLLRDLVATWKSSSKSGSFLAGPNVAVTRHIRFVWCIKSKGQLRWFASQLAEVVEDVKSLQEQGAKVEVDMSVYCTCDEQFTEEHRSLLSAWQSSSRPEKHLLDRVDVRSDSTIGVDLDEKTDHKKKVPVSRVTEVNSSGLGPMSTEEDTSTECEANSRCCCKTTIEDEDAILAHDPAAPRFTCTCGAAPMDETTPLPPVKRTASTSTRSSAPSLDKFLCHPSIALYSGRPQSRNIMRKSLEQAMGESAVVVCGPRGLVDDLRRSYVGLCDERAVCKGTGAMGVYFHAEGFAY